MDWCTLIEQGLGDRDDGDEQIDTKVGVCIRRKATSALPRMPLVFHLGISLLIMQ